MNVDCRWSSLILYSSISLYQGGKLWNILFWSVIVASTALNCQALDYNPQGVVEMPTLLLRSKDISFMRLEQE